MAAATSFVVTMHVVMSLVVWAVSHSFLQVLLFSECTDNPKAAVPTPRGGSNPDSQQLSRSQLHAPDYGHPCRDSA